MTDRVLTVEEVGLLASLNETFVSGLPKADARALVLSHRLLQQRAKELEDEVASYRASKRSVDEALNSGDGTYRP